MSLGTLNKAFKSMSKTVSFGRLCLTKIGGKG